MLVRLTKVTALGHELGQSCITTHMKRSSSYSSDSGSEAGIQSIVAAVEAHRNPAAAWPLWFGVAILAVGALAALSFIRRSEESHSHLK